MATATTRTNQPSTPEQQPQERNSLLSSSSTTSSSPSRGAKRQEHDSASESSSVHSGETSERRDIDIVAQVLSTRSEEYRLLFRLPPEEVLVQDFNCALQENILLQGHMYLFIHNICFYSNIFGFETKRTICFNEITSIRKAKTAAIFPNAIEIVSGTKKHFFGSFLSRDEAYKLILDGWAQHNSEVKTYLERQDYKNDNNGQDVVVILDKVILDNENGPKQQADDPTCVERLSSRVPEISENGNSNGDSLHLGQALSWEFEDVDAPTVHEYFSKVAEATFPVCLEDFFNFFISDAAAADFLENFHKTCGDKDFQCSRWHRHIEAGYIRDVSFQHPIKIYFGAKFGNCQEIQKFRVYRNSHLVIEISQQISDVPYGDYFHVQGLWDVEENVDSGNICSLRIYVNVAFSRKTMWKGKIEQSTREEYREVSGIWINNAHELLKQKKLVKKEGINGNTMNMTSNPDIGLMGLQELEEVSESVHIARPQTSSTLALSTQNCDPLLQEVSRFATSMISILREFVTNICSYVKSETHISPICVVAFLFIAILLQMSIIMLVSRSPEVHVIPEANYMSGINSGRKLTIDLLEKQMFYLSEEMLMIETRLERMHHEYRLLKSHLQALTESHSKS